MSQERGLLYLTTKSFTRTNIMNTDKAIAKYGSMNYESLYHDFIAYRHPECYGNEDRMFNNWERGFAFDEFAEFLDLTLDQLLEAV